MFNLIINLRNNCYDVTASLTIKLSLEIMIHKCVDMKPWWYAIAIVRNSNHEFHPHSMHQRQGGSYYPKNAASY